MARKGRNIYKRKDGRWEGRIIKGYNEQGKRKYHSVYGKNYSEVKQKMQDYISVYGNFKGNGKTIDYILFFWLEDNKKSWKQSTYANYRRIIEYHLIPYWKNINPEDLGMLFIESIPVWMIRTMSVTNILLYRLIMKLPIFLFDNIAVVTLIKMYPEKLEYIALLYYTSPIIIYSGYMHGQLDIIPTAILFLTIYVLLKRNKGYVYSFAVLFAIAVLTKQHTIAIAPVLFVFYAKRDGIRKCLKSLFLFLGIIVAGSIPFWSDGFINSVVFNKEQNQLMEVYLSLSIFIRNCVDREICIFF